MSADGPRVALVTNVLAHYRLPCFRRLAELLPGRVDFFFLSADMEHRRYVLAEDAAGASGAQGGPGGLPGSVLDGWRWRRPPEDDLHWSDVRPVTRGRYDALILGGWSEPAYLELWLRHLPRRTATLFWVESTLHDRRRGGARELLKRTLLGAAAGCLVPGTRAREYCRRLGMAEERIFTAPNAADREAFRRRADELLPRRAELRAELGLEAPTFLFAGRLVESIKGVEALVRAVARLAAGGRPATLVLAGDGPDRERYRALAEELGAEVRFAGVVDHTTLCRYYAAADVLVLPSRSETWGFVLNEAMEFGLPLVVSEAVGAGPDLVREGENGYVVPPDDPAALAGVLGRLAADPDLRRRLGLASRERVEAFSPEAWARGVAGAVTGVCGESEGERSR